MRVLKLLAATTAVTLAGCQADSSDIASRLKSGDTTVCADPTVQETFITVLVGDQTYRDFLANGNKLPPLKVVNATGVNKDIGEVSCSGNFEFPKPVFGQAGARVDFKIRPALDEGGGFVVESSKEDAGNAVVGSWIALSAIKENSDERLDPENAAMSTDDAMNATDMNAEDYVPSDVDENTPDMNATEEPSGY